MTQLLPLSLLNDFLYCPRRAALKAIDGLRSANEHTAQGDLNHWHADLPGYEHRAGWKLLRALPVWSDELGLNGKADLVEVREYHGMIAEARPVEYKSGKKSRWSNDHAQLCAQAFCLEQMLDITIQEGAIYHAKSSQRTRIEFTPVLRAETLAAIASLHRLIAAASIPAPILSPRCDGCSLRDTCLPEISNLPPQNQTQTRNLKSEISNLKSQP
jgi:CRISPR-associated exonuclease Cas4